MRRARRIGISDEEKVARRIGKEVSDFSLDLESVGRYLAKALPYTIYVRAMHILEAGQYYRQEVEEEHYGHHDLNRFQ